MKRIQHEIYIQLKTQQLKLKKKEINQTHNMLLIYSCSRVPGTAPGKFKSSP